MNRHGTGYHRILPKLEPRGHVPRGAEKSLNTSPEAPNQLKIRTTTGLAQQKAWPWLLKAVLTGSSY